MAGSDTDHRIHELKKRLAIEPASPAFVALAEEYRRAGRLAEALETLRRGLARRPGYLSAQVALGRVLLETGQTDEAIAMFSKALSGDPANLVSARSLADIYLSRGEKVEAIKKYKLYRGISGDRRVDGIIEKLEGELGHPAAAPAGRTLADLYFEQGHFADAAAIYGELAAAAPGDPELFRLQARAEGLARGGGAGVSAPPEASASRRDARIAALKRWLSVVQTR